MNSKIWLSSPHMSGNEQKYVQEAFDSNWIAPKGPNISGFENDLEVYLKKKKHIACLSSGTAAIHIALIQLGVAKGDEVLCQSFTFCGSANPIIYVGANPIFIDSEIDTWNMCPDFLEEAILDRLSKGKKPKAIIFVHLYGMPAKIDAIVSIANKYDIPLIEDAAEALGSKYKGENCGTFGDFSILSFNGNKIITTSGGGALICNTKKEKLEAIFYATQARDSYEHYEHSKIGFNYRMSNICAGIGRGQIEVLGARINKRRDNHSFYKQLFINSNDISILQEPDEDYYSNYWLSTILIDRNAKFNKDIIINHLNQYNIEARSLWKPMHLQPVFSKYDYFGSNISSDFFDRGICLPSGSNITDIQREKISSVLSKFAISTF